jgi:hypothetical protein
VHFTCVCGLDGIWITGRNTIAHAVVWAIGPDEEAAA